MLKYQFSANYRKIVSLSFCLLLFAFILKELFFISIIPMHQGSDEYVHYATVQYFAEPKEKTWPITEGESYRGNTKNIDIYHYTQEISKFAELTNSKEFSGAPRNTQNFTPEVIQNVESEMRSGKYLPYFDRYPITIVGGGKLVHRIGAIFEKILSRYSVFERYFALRILAIFYGLITVICAYFIALWSGFKRHHALFLAGLVAFQPQFGATTAIINYDPLLIAAFSVFLLGAVSILRHSLNWKNALVVLASPVVATLTKGIGVMLVPLATFIILWGFYRKFVVTGRIRLWKYLFVILAICAMTFFLIPKRYMSIVTDFPPESRGKTLSESLNSYWQKEVLNPKVFERTSTTYWGTFGWLDTTIHGQVTKNIRLVEYASLFGLAFLFIIYLKDIMFSLFKNMRALFSKTYAKKLASTGPPTKVGFLSKKPFIPEWQFLLLFAAVFAALQFAIRLYDWRGWYLGGEGVGTPGRYFLPAIIPHFMLVTTGFGAFFRSHRTFGIILRILFALMVLLSLYAILLIIVPRYYL